MDNAILIFIGILTYTLTGISVEMGVGKEETFFATILLWPFLLIFLITRKLME